MESIVYLYDSEVSELYSKGTRTLYRMRHGDEYIQLPRGFWFGPVALADKVKTWFLTAELGQSRDQSCCADYDAARGVYLVHEARIDGEENR